MINLLNLLDDTPKIIIIIASFISVLLFGLVDYLIGPEVAFSIFYLLPISMISWYAGKKYGLSLSALSAAVWLAADLASGHIYSFGLIPVWNSVMRLGMFAFIAVLLTELRRYLNELHKRDLQLQREATIIQTSQKLSAVLAENLTQQNAEILKWIEVQKKEGREVDPAVERASKIIGSSLHVLTEVSFVTPFTERSSRDVDTHMQLLIDKLDRVHESFEAYYNQEEE